MGIFKRERRKDRSEIPVNALKKQLEHFAQEGDYKAAMLATGNGFIAVDNGSGLETDQLTDIAGLAWNLSRTVYGKDFMEGTDQIFLRDGSGSTICCSFFVVARQLVALTFLTQMDSAKHELTERTRQGITRIITGE
jgi:hypothetical protein